VRGRPVNGSSPESTEPDAVALAGAELDAAALDDDGGNDEPCPDGDGSAPELDVEQAAVSNAPESAKPHTARARAPNNMPDRTDAPDRFVPGNCFAGC